jgi:hypothetical protein
VGSPRDSFSPMIEPYPCNVGMTGLLTGTSNVHVVVERQVTALLA